jgi:hypothetical protein
MPNPLFYNTQMISAIGTWCATMNSGFMQLMTGTQPALNAALTGSEVAKLTFSATAYATATASGGIVTAVANAIASDTNATGGTAGYACLLASNGTTVIMTLDVGTSGASLNLSSLTITGGSTVACSAFSVTLPQG